MINLIPILGTIIDKIASVIDQTVEDKDLANKIKAEIKLQLLTKEYDRILKELEAKRDIIIAEATGQSWIQRNWRPLTMLVFVYIIAHNFIISPLLSIRELPIPPDMWELLKVGMGGYIIGRSAEKITPEIVKAIKCKDNNTPPIQ
jgi:hypothetical protein